ncbi:MAG: molybdopterin-synthase adenylyltransferase MoeB [Gammaproteobacteria bacterium]|nr:molybdopterin-synthase adenylyltransferase MoeB [Gammaproteobacteria bacterium]
MDDDELLRYSRQIILPDFEYQGQEKLKKSRILLIGLGGLGSPIALYLAAAGIGNLVINDFDSVEVSNLQRQIIHSTESIGQEKVISAKERIQAINPLIQVDVLDKKLTEQELSEQIKLADIVVDASDNFQTRFLINRLSCKHQTPLISGAAIRYEGQISLFNASEQSPCYQCLYDDNGQQEDLTCSANGVLGPLLGVIGSMQAIEVIKFIVGFGRSLSGRLMILDAKQMQWREIKLAKDPECPICSR